MRLVFLTFGCAVAFSAVPLAGVEDDRAFLDLKATELEESVARIEREFGVRIYYLYDAETFFPYWRSSPYSARGEPIDVEGALRMLPIIKSFLGKYSKRFIAQNLSRIYLLKRMSFYGREFAGTYLANGIYVANPGWDTGFVEATLHSEFSSILYNNYEFPVRRWCQVNGENWRYKGYGKDYDCLDDPDLCVRKEELLAEGFLCKYGYISIEEDFNTYIDCLINHPFWLLLQRKVF